MSAPAPAGGGGGTVLEEMVVRLTADIQAYLKGMKDAQDKANETAAKAETTANKIKEIAEGIKNVGEAAAGVFGAIGIGVELKGVFEKFDEYQRNIRRLNAVVESGGHSATLVVPEYREYAKSLTEVSTASTGAVMKLFQAAEAFGTSGEQAKKAVGDALALAKGDTDTAEAYIRVTAPYAQGNIARAQSMSRLIRELRGLRDEEEFQVRYQRLISSGSRIMGEDANDTSGKIEKLGRTFNMLKIGMGESVDKAIEPLVGVLVRAGGAYQQLDPSIKSSIGNLAMFTGATIALSSSLPRLVGLLTATKLAYGALFVGVAAGVALYEANKDVQELNKSLAEAEKLAGARATMEAKRGQERLKVGEAISGPEDRRSYFTEQVKEQQARVDQYSQSLERNKKYLEDHTTVNLGFVKAYSGSYDTFKQHEAGVAADEKALEAAKEALAAYNEQLKESSDEAVTQKAVKGLQDYEAVLRKQIATFGMSHDEAKRYELRQAGVRGEQLKNAESLGREHEAQQQKKKDLQDTAHVLQEMFTPLDKFNEKASHLDYLFFEAQTLTLDQYNKALKHAGEEYEKAADGASKFQAALELVKGTISGTSDSLSKAEAQTRGFEHAAAAALKTAAVTNPSNVKFVDPSVVNTEYKPIPIPAESMAPFGGRGRPGANAMPGEPSLEREGGPVMPVVDKSGYGIHGGASKEQWDAVKSAFIEGIHGAIHPTAETQKQQTEILRQIASNTNPSRAGLISAVAANFASA